MNNTMCLSTTQLVHCVVVSGLRRASYHQSRYESHEMEVGDGSKMTSMEAESDYKPEAREMAVCLSWGRLQ